MFHKNILVCVLTLMLLGFARGRRTTCIKIHCSCLSQRISCVKTNLESIPDDLLTSAKTIHLHNSHGGSFNFSKNLTNLHTLSLTSYSLESIDFNIVLKYLPNLKYLNLRSNRLKQLHVESSTALKVEYLDLSDNLLGNISIKSGLENLQKFLVAENLLTNVDNSFNSMPSLSYLVLESNLLSHVKKTMFEALPSLQHIGMNGNKLESIDFPITHHKLHTLLATDNKLQVINHMNLTNLMTIDLSKNMLESCSFGNTSITNILSINLRENRITQCVLNVLEMPNLRYLTVASNKIRSFSFSNFQNLESIDMSGNTITEIPPNGIILPSLKNLDLSECQIRYLNFSTGLIGVESLRLKKNLIRKIIDLKLNMPRLKFLDLSDNLIEKFEWIEGNHRLEELSLKHNKLTYLSFRQDLNIKLLRTINLAWNSIAEVFFSNSKPWLWSIDLSNNIVSKIHFLNISHIRTLNLERNNVTYFGDMFSSPRLRRLDLSSNYLRKDLHIERMKSLGTFLISKNAIESLSIGHNMDMLMVLNAEGNIISSVNISNSAKNLQVVQLNQNRLTCLHVTSNSDVRVISLENNKVSSLQSISCGRKIEVLYLSENIIHSFQSMDMSCRNVINLDVSFNLIKRVIEVSYFPNAKILQMENNLITDIKLDALSSPKLEVLKLGYNKISTLSAVDARLPVLLTLELQYNRLASVELENRFPLLANIFLQGNMLTAINSDEIGVKGVVKLFADNNDIKTVCVNAFNSLSYLSLINNSISSLRLPSKANSDINTFVFVTGNPIICSCSTLHVDGSFTEGICHTPLKFRGESIASFSSKYDVCNQRKENSSDSTPTTEPGRENAINWKIPTIIGGGILLTILFLYGIVQRREQEPEEAADSARGTGHHEHVNIQPDCACAQVMEVPGPST